MPVEGTVNLCGQDGFDFAAAAAGGETAGCLTGAGNHSVAALTGAPIAARGQNGLKGGIGAALCLIEGANALLAAFLQQMIRLLRLRGEGGTSDPHSLRGPSGCAGAVQKLSHDRPYLADLLVNGFEQIQRLLPSQQSADIFLEGGLLGVWACAIRLVVMCINHMVNNVSPIV